jgi:predicted RNA-binding Zn-ribbon protein involved in translation (DUF1610 family)
MAKRRKATTEATPESTPGPRPGSADDLVHWPPESASRASMAIAADRQTVVRPARCPKCGSTSHVVARKIVERDVAGEIAGQPFDRVIWRRLRCRKCEQLYTARFYEFSGRN